MCDVLVPVHVLVQEPMGIYLPVEKAAVTRVIDSEVPCL